MIFISSTQVYTCVLYIYICIMNTQIQLESVANAKEGNTVEPLYCGHPWDMNNHIYSTLFKIQERKSDRRSREIEQRKELQNTHTHKTRTCELNLLH